MKPATAKPQTAKTKAKAKARSTERKSIDTGSQSLALSAGQRSSSAGQRSHPLPSKGKARAKSQVKKSLRILATVQQPPSSSSAASQKDSSPQLSAEGSKQNRSSNAEKGSPGLRLTETSQLTSLQDDLQETLVASSSGRERGVLENMPPRNLASQFFNVAPASAMQGFTVVPANSSRKSINELAESAASRESAVHLTRVAPSRASAVSMTGATASRDSAVCVTGIAASRDPASNVTEAAASLDVAVCVTGVAASCDSAFSRDSALSCDLAVSCDSAEEESGFTPMGRSRTHQLHAYETRFARRSTCHQKIGERLAASRRGTWVHRHHRLPWAILAGLTALQVCGSSSFLVSIDYSRNPVTHDLEYHQFSTVLVSNCAQTAVFACLAAFRERSKLSQVHWPTFYYSFVAGFFWAVYENLATISVLLCGAGTAALVQQSRVVFTAVIRTVLIGAHLTELHWHGMAMLLVSTIGCQFYAMDEGGLSFHTKKDLFARVHSVQLGTVVCVLAALSYACATVLSEKLYKDPRFAHISFEAKFLYIISRKLVFSGLYTFASCFVFAKKAVFAGWTAKTVLVPTALFLQVVTMHLVLLKLDALICCLGEIVSFACVYWLEFLMLDKGVRPVELCFMILVIQSVTIFVRISSTADIDEVKQKDRVLDDMSGRWKGFLDDLELKATDFKFRATEAVQTGAASVRKKVRGAFGGSPERGSRRAMDSASSTSQVVASSARRHSYSESSDFLERSGTSSPPPFFEAQESQRERESHMEADGSSRRVIRETGPSDALSSTDMKPTVIDEMESPMKAVRSTVKLLDTE